ncbi:hypothetical protein RRG08_002190 [Elysia crispata]|uniref:Uncharacterized protein n=1 Tax=Elysia crispata TaxID=231223 RepID=A0AAE1DCY8_9GAST|nr:hypothetical protein RRG08_002190 [Elysia crispata]
MRTNGAELQRIRKGDNLTYGPHGPETLVYGKSLLGQFSHRPRVQRCWKTQAPSDSDCPISFRCFMPLLFYYLLS